MWPTGEQLYLPTKAVYNLPKVVELAIVEALKLLSIPRMDLRQWGWRGAMGACGCQINPILQ